MAEHTHDPGCQSLVVLQACPACNPRAKLRAPVLSSASQESDLANQTNNVRSER
jgi:hypothetical protein